MKISPSSIWHVAIQLKPFASRLRIVCQHIDPFIILILALPFAVLTYDQSWLITYPSFLDPWYSLAYFRDLPAALRFVSDYYASDRLAYWIPGNVVYHVFSPLWANYVLRFCYFYLATLAYYYTASRTLGRKTALVGTVLMGTYWHFQAEIGWSYVDGAGVAYTLLATAALTRARRGTARSFWIAAAGAAFACAVNTNIVLAETILPLFIYHVGCARQDRTLRPIPRDVVAFLAGGLILTVVLGAYYYSVTHRVLYTASLSFVRHQAKAGRDRSTVGELGYEIPPFTTWFPTAHWLVLPSVATCAALLFAVFRIRRRSLNLNPHVLLFQATFLVHAALFVTIHLLSIVYVLVIPWYTIYLLPFMYLALGGLLARAVEALHPATVVGACGLGVGELFGLCYLPAEWRELIVFPTLFGLSFLSAYVRRGQATALVLVMGIFGAYNYKHIVHNRDTYIMRKDSYLAITDGVRVIEQEHIPIRMLAFWYKPQSQMEINIFTSLNSAYLWGYTLYNFDFPNLQLDAAGRLVAPTKPFLAVLTNDPGAFQTVVLRLRGVNVSATLIRQERIIRGDVSFNLILIRCEPINQAVPPP